MNSRPQRQAYALSFAMSQRPTPQLATTYFAALKKMLWQQEEGERGCKNKAGERLRAVR